MNLFRDSDQDLLEILSSGKREEQKIRVLDLFAGFGGFSLGFTEAGFDVTGVDNEKVSSQVFKLNGVGSGVCANLLTDMETHDVPIVIGGPPCRPWSAVNLVRRGAHHKDHALVERYFAHLREIRPRAFLMENVPAMGSDPEFRRLLEALRSNGYSVARSTLRYSDFGAASTRRRLFTVGFRDSAKDAGEEFFKRLAKHERDHSTVRQAIGWLEHLAREEVPDHEWSNVRTIEKYRERYKTGQYGWRQLDWDVPAPSFGSVSKTYILHPSAGEGDYPLRVLSVREVLSIMGFPRSFRFPEGTGISKRYGMAANTVSPIVAEACAWTLREMLSE